MSLADKLRLAHKEPTWRKRPEVLLCVQIPKPLHGVNPRTVLGAKWWKETREKAFISTEYHCLACGVAKYAARGHQWLEGHEVYRVDYLKGTSTYLETVALCHFCHNFIHCGRMQAMVDQGKMVLRKQLDILEHGSGVLGAAGLEPKIPYPGPFAPWAKWRLVVGRKKYKPKYKSLEDLERYYLDEDNLS